MPNVSGIRKGAPFFPSPRLFAGEVDARGLAAPVQLGASASDDYEFGRRRAVSDRAATRPGPSLLPLAGEGGAKRRMRAFFQRVARVTALTPTLSRKRERGPKSATQSLALNREIGERPNPEIVRDRPSVAFMSGGKFAPQRQCGKAHIHGGGDKPPCRKPKL